jgi:hypothetical protein
MCYFARNGNYRLDLFCTIIIHIAYHEPIRKNLMVIFSNIYPCRNSCFTTFPLLIILADSTLSLLTAVFEKCKLTFIWTSQYIIQDPDNKASLLTHARDYHVDNVFTTPETLEVST